jgi:hypothetical protein
VVGVVHTEAGMVSGWHHHGGYETVIYVLTGLLRMEFGPGGATTVVAGPGDFVYVPTGVVHRESIPPQSQPISSWCALVGASPRSTSMGRRKSEVALGLGGDRGPQPEDEAGCPVAETALRDRLDDLRRYVSAKCKEPLCQAPFSQVAADRRCRS